MDSLAKGIIGVYWAIVSIALLSLALVPKEILTDGVGAFQSMADVYCFIGILFFNPIALIIYMAMIAHWAFRKYNL